MKLQLDSSLAQIVQTVKSAGYRESHQLHVQPATLESTTWRMYTRGEENGLVKIAYVSDASEIVARETFTPILTHDQGSDRRKEEQMLEELLNNYQAGEQAIEDAKSQGWRLTLYAAGAAALVGFYGGRLPGAVLAAGLTAVVMQFPRSYMVLRAEQQLEGYLSNHNIKTGQDALASVARKE